MAVSDQVVSDYYQEVAGRSNDTNMVQNLGEFNQWAVDQGVTQKQLFNTFGGEENVNAFKTWANDEYDYEWQSLNKGKYVGQKALDEVFGTDSASPDSTWYGADYTDPTNLANHRDQFATTEGVYDMADNRSQREWNTGSHNIKSGSITEKEAIDKFLADQYSRGMTAQEIEAAMGWDAGTVSAWEGTSPQPTEATASGSTDVPNAHFGAGGAGATSNASSGSAGTTYTSNGSSGSAGTTTGVVSGSAPQQMKTVTVPLTTAQIKENERAALRGGTPPHVAGTKQVPVGGETVNTGEPAGGEDLGTVNIGSGDVPVQVPPESYSLDSDWEARIVALGPNATIAEQEAAILDYIDLALTYGFTFEQIDQARGLPAGSTIRWAKKAGWEGNGKFTSTPVGSPLATQDTSSVYSSAPGTKMITEGEAVNSATENSIGVAEIGTGTVIQAGHGANQYYDLNAMFDTRDSTLTSDFQAAIINENSPVMQAVANRVLENMNAMGRVGDSAHAGALAKALIEASLPIAQSNSQVDMNNAQNYNNMMRARQDNIGATGAQMVNGTIQMYNNMSNTVGDMLIGNLEQGWTKENSTQDQEELLQELGYRFENDKWIQVSTNESAEKRSMLSAMGPIFSAGMNTNTEIVASDASNKEELIAYNTANVFSSANMMNQVMDGGGEFYIEDFDLAVLDLPSESSSDSKFSNANYSSNAQEKHTTTTLQRGDDLAGLVSHEIADLASIDDLNEARKQGTLSQEQYDYIKDLRWWDANGSSYASKAPNGYKSAIDVYVRDGLSPESLATMRSLVESDRSSTDEGSALEEKEAEWNARNEDWFQQFI